MPELLDFVLHVDQHLASLVAWAGTWGIAAIAAIVFCETGLVVMPFLPGDSLLFAAGALAATGAFDVWALGLSLFVAAVVGDAVNYAVGHRLGRPAAGRLVRPERLAQTEAFFARHGGRAVVLARFVPIVRTLAPFVAGMGAMPYGRFVRYNLLGAVLWVVPFVGAGYAFGSMPVVQDHFGLLVVAVIVLSIVPLAVEVVRHRRTAPLAS
jgi:membrane-associated protein